MRTALLPGRLLAVVVLASVARGQDATPGRTVVCTGTVEPTNIVEVTAPVPGRVVRMGPDPRAAADPQYAGKTVDFSTPVEPGTLLLQLDDQTYRAELEQAKARLAVAEAELQAAKGSRAGGDALVLAEARLRERRADVTLAELRLSQTVITSPTKGVVIACRVKPGQVVAPYVATAGTLMLIGDLTHYEVWAKVDEAEVAKVHAGQRARFTTDAIPGVTFAARVAQVRLDAERMRDRTSYTVVLSMDNGDGGGRLIPYLTAHIEIDTETPAATAPSTAPDATR
jgi:HlyD family secretion protein